MNRRGWAEGTAAVLGAIVLVGCGGSEQGGMVGNKPISDDGLKPIGTTQALTGTVLVAGNGCILFRPDSDRIDRWTIWPTGTQQLFADDGTTIVGLADGGRLASGQRISAAGQFISRSDLPDGDDVASLWGSAAGCCLDGLQQGATEIVRFSSVQKS